MVFCNITRKAQHFAMRKNALEKRMVEALELFGIIPHSVYCVTILSGFIKKKNILLRMEDLTADF